MGKIDFVQGAFVTGHVDPVARGFHRIQSEMLHAGHRMALDARGKSCAHFAHKVRILAIGFLRTAPCGVAQQIHADATEQRTSLDP